MAAAAYRLGLRIKDELVDATKDYRHKGGEEVMAWAVCVPKGEEVPTPRNLWNAAERAEVRSDARPARSIIIAIPHDIPDLLKARVIERYTQALCDRYGVACDYSIHKKEGNIHAHIGMTTRRYKNGELGEKTKEIDHIKTGPQEVEWMRQKWQAIANKSLEFVKSDARVDMRSYERQGIDKIPGVHLGPKRNYPKFRAQALEQSKMKAELARQELYDATIAYARRPAIGGPMITDPTIDYDQRKNKLERAPPTREELEAESNKLEAEARAEAAKAAKAAAKRAGLTR